MVVTYEQPDNLTSIAFPIAELLRRMLPLGSFKPAS